MTGSNAGYAINWANGVTGTSTERAIGLLNSGSVTSPKSIAFSFINNTGAPINALDITFDYEKYRSGSRAFNWTFFHGAGTNVAIEVAAGGHAYAADANNNVVHDPPLSVAKSFSLTGLEIANGATYTLRWTLTGVGGSSNGQGLGIDNFSMTPTSTTPYAAAQGASLDFGYVLNMTNSVAQEIVIVAGNLTPLAGNVIVSAPQHYQVSDDGGLTWDDSVELPYEEGGLGPTIVLVRFSPTVSGVHNSSLAITAGDASSTMALKGFAVTNMPTTIYSHDFGTSTVPFSHPYTVAPPVIDANLSNSEWSNNLGTWSNTTGSTGRAISRGVGTGTHTFTLDLDIAPGYLVEVTGFSYWQRSGTVNGPTTWSMAIEGQTVGGGTIPSVTGANTGLQSVSTTSTNIAGSVQVVLTLTGASSSVTYIVDDFTLFGSVFPGTDPLLEATATTLGFPTTAQNTTSATQTFDLDGFSLDPADGTVTVTAPAGTDFQLSLDGSTGWASSIDIEYEDGAFDDVPVYVRFAPDNLGPQSGSLLISGGGAQDITVQVSGNASLSTPSTIYFHDFGTTEFSSITNYAVVPPVLDPHLSNSSWTHDGGNWNSTNNADYIVSGRAIGLLTAGTGLTRTITITFDVEPGYQLEVSDFSFHRVRTGTTANAWAMSINGTPVGSGTIPDTEATLPITPVSSTVNGLTGQVQVTLALTGGTAIGQNVYFDDFTLIGAVTLSGDPLLVPSPTSLTFPTTVQNTVSATQTFALEGFHLTPADGNITVHAPAGTDFLLSADGNAPWETSIDVPYTGGEFTGATVHVQFAPTSVGVRSGDITFSGGGVTIPATVAVSGNGAVVEPVVIYHHNFGTSASIATPYVQPPVVFADHLSGSSWVRGGGNWATTGTGVNAASGRSLYVGSSSGETITLTFEVAQGFALEITGHSLWHKRLAAGPHSYGITVNGIPVGTGSVPDVGAETGLVPVTNTCTGLTGTITVVITLTTAPSENGGYYLDDFRLHGSVVPAATVVQFVGAASQVGEEDGTTELTLSILNPDPVNATTVDVVLVSGDASRINGYTTQTVTFPGGSSGNQALTITVTDNGVCDGDEVLTFGLQNGSGGVGTVVLGANDGFGLTITDNESIVDPVTTAATAVGSDSFTATWSPINGATNYYLDVYTIESTPTTDLFISEYIEGSSNNKYLEIFNGTGSAVDLGAYELRHYNNGSPTPTYTYPMTGSLADGATIVYRNNSASIYGGAATPIGNVMSYNGDDAIALYNTATASFVDIFGEIDIDPGSAWTVGGNTTENRTLVRNSTVTGGNTVNAAGFPTLGTEWTMFAENTITGLGTHTYNGSGPVHLPGYDNFNAGTATSAVISDLDPETTYYYVVRAVGGCASANTSNETEVTTTPLPNVIYYSQASGDVNDGIWDVVTPGTPGPATFSANATMVVQAGHVVTNTDAVEVNDVVVDEDGKLVLSSGSVFTVHGALVSFNGSVDALEDSEMILVGDEASITSLSFAPDTLWHLTVNTPSGTALNMYLGIQGTLQIGPDASFDAGTGRLTLVSGPVDDVVHTGNLGPVVDGAVFTGDLTMQRYIPEGVTNWRLLGSAVQDATVLNWKDDFITAGFPDSHYPNFDTPAGSGNLWPSIRKHDEPDVPGSSLPQEVAGVDGTTEPLEVGRGFGVWCGDLLTGTNAFVVDVTGEPNIATTPIALPVSNELDGWNLVSNPLPSAIDFTAIQRTNNVENRYQIYDPVEGSMKVWDGDVPSADPGVTGVIASSQGFWLKASGPTPIPSATVDENAKVPGEGGGLFGGEEDGTAVYPVVDLVLSGSANSFRDRTKVIFGLGTPGYEGADVLKVGFGHQQAPAIGTLAPTGELLKWSKFGAYATDIAIPVAVRTRVNGTSTITMHVSQTSLSCLWLEDLVTGALTPVTDGAQYSFTQAPGTEMQQRFVLHATAPLAFTAEDGLCGPGSGSATVDVGAGPNDVTWTTATGTVLLEQPGTSGEVSFTNVPAGQYTVRVSAPATVCGELVHDFSIGTEGQPVEMTIVAPASALVDEAVLFTGVGTEGVSYFWDFGDGWTSTETAPLHTFTSPGEYVVSLTVTLDDCSITTTTMVVVTFSTGVDDLTGADANVWGGRESFIVEHGLGGGLLGIEVMDASGRLWFAKNYAAVPGRITVPARDLATGVWFVRLTHEGYRETFRVPLVR